MGLLLLSGDLQRESVEQHDAGLEKEDPEVSDLGVDHGSPERTNEVSCLDSQSNRSEEGSVVVVVRGSHDCDGSPVEGSSNDEFTKTR